ncbi:MAG: hypothetical protein ACKOXB_12485 [Flavobacteriales bacterium]
MKKYLFLLNCFLVITYAKAQYITFVDSINIRETPSISSRVIGVLRHNTYIQEDYDGEPSIKDDSIGGFKSYWLLIKHNDISGYVWSPLLTTINITSKTNSQNNILVHSSGKKRIEFKVLKNDSLLHYSSFEKKEHRGIENCISFGTTFNSQGKEIIGIKYDVEQYKYDLFEWDGKTIQPSTIKLNDASAITGKYLYYNVGYINSNNVKVRATPDSNGVVIDRIGLNTPVEIFKIGNNSIKFNGEWGYWQAIKYKNREGFVWSTYVDVPLRYIKSNRNDSESFLFTTNAIYVLDRGKISNSYKFKFESFYYRDSTTFHGMYNYIFVDYGNRGLGTKYTILGLYFPRESGSQEDFYIWDKVKLNYIGSYCAGEDYMCSSYTFPDVSGIKDRIIETRYEENNYFNYDNFRFYKQKYLMLYNGDSLVEVPSKYSWLRENMKSKFPTHRIVHTRFLDLDNDGIEDVMFTLQNKSGAQVVGFAFGNIEGIFHKFKFNNSIGSKGVVFELECNTPNTFEIKVEYSDSDYSVYRFIYDKTLDNYLWHSVSTVRTTDGDKGRYREKKTKQFKTKKILFEDSWESNLYMDIIPSEIIEE